MSLFGYYSRFHQGLFSLIAFLILYWAFVSNISGKRGCIAGERRLTNSDICIDPLKIPASPARLAEALAKRAGGCVNPSDYISKLILTITLSSLIVAAYGIAQHFGIDAFHWVQDVQFRVFSTMGQPNWLGAYLAIILLIIFPQILIYYSKNNAPSNFKFLILNFKSIFKFSPFIFYLLTFNLLYACLLFTRSRSAFTAFHVCFFILTIFLFKKFKKIFITIYLMFFILINVFNILPTPIEKINQLTIPNIVNKISAGINRSQSVQKMRARPSQLFSKSGEGGTESFSIRRIVWKGAWNAYRANPIFGYGNETFALAYYRYKPVEQNLVSEWDFLYNKAHNEYLNYLATTGTVGFLTYIFLIISFSIYFIRSCEKNSLNLGLYFAWVTILITNFVGFSVVAISLFFYLIPAIMVVINENPKQSPPTIIHDYNLKQIAIFLFTILLIVNCELLIVKWWLADITFTRAQAATSQGEYNLAFQEYSSAIELSPYHPVYHSEFSISLSEMASYFNSQKEKSLAKNLVEKAIDEGNLAAKISPNNLIFHNYQALVFHNIEFADKKYSRRAVDAILASYALSPNDPKITYYMAIYLLEDGQISRAMKAFEITQKLKPNYVEAMSNYAKLLADIGKQEKARQILEKLLKYYPGNLDIIKLIKTYKN
jgi:O-antigen ligase